MSTKVAPCLCSVIREAAKDLSLLLPLQVYRPLACSRLLCPYNGVLVSAKDGAVSTSGSHVYQTQGYFRQRRRL
jgi:hypothetical protein